TVGEMDDNAGRGRDVVVIGDLVVAAATIDEVVAGTALERFVGRKGVVAAVERVIGRGAEHAVDVGEAVVADRRVAVGSARGKIHRHATGRAQVRQPGRDLAERVDAAGDDVIAALAFELVETGNSTGQSRRTGEACRIEG